MIYSELGLGSWARHRAGGGLLHWGSGLCGVSRDPVGCPRAPCPHPRSLRGGERVPGARLLPPPGPGLGFVFLFRRLPPAGPGALTRLRGCGTGQHRASRPCPKRCGHGAAAPRPRGHRAGPGGGTAPGPARARGGGRRFATVWLCFATVWRRFTTMRSRHRFPAVWLHARFAAVWRRFAAAPFPPRFPAERRPGSAPAPLAFRRGVARPRGLATVGRRRRRGPAGAMDVGELLSYQVPAPAPAPGTGLRGAPAGAAPSAGAGCGLCAVPSDGAALRRGRRGLGLRRGPRTEGRAPSPAPSPAGLTEPLGCAPGRGSGFGVAESTARPCCPQLGSAFGVLHTRISCWLFVMTLE